MANTIGNYRNVERDREIIRLVKQGLSDNEIAPLFKLSTRQIARIRKTANIYKERASHLVRHDRLGEP